MAFLSSMNITGSGLTAQQLRLDVISENVSNINTTRVEGGGGPYQRKIVVMEADGGRNTFRDVLAKAAGNIPAATGDLSETGGVRVTQIVEDTSPFKLQYDPTHPDANEEGYVEMPNVDLVKEVTDAMAATQAFSANVTAFNTLKTVATRALDIGK
ncbi:MAG TPA: flagellar basal body rod protein FlgC [Candidatus Agathobaculum intestinipullorum]|nr:flagellar basal body rod protein FlgC [Candidatus Agathobaculum intestinipullorum]